MNIEKIVSEIILVGLGFVISTACWLTAIVIKEVMDEQIEEDTMQVDIPEE